MHTRLLIGSLHLLMGEPELLELLASAMWKRPKVTDAHQWKLSLDLVHDGWL